MTNFEIIKSLNEEALAEYLANVEVNQFQDVEDGVVEVLAEKWKEYLAQNYPDYLGVVG